jgi:hypothetical protein
MTFYTYLWLREDGTPYYVGKGKGNRAIRKGSPTDLDRVLIQEFPCEADAFSAEKFLIAYYGRKDNGTGILRNLTDGGEGGQISWKCIQASVTKRLGRLLTQEHKRQISWQGRTHTAATKAKMRGSRRGGMQKGTWQHTPETLARLRAGLQDWRQRENSF